MEQAAQDPARPHIARRMFDELPDRDNISPIRIGPRAPSPGMCTPTRCSSGFCCSAFVGSDLLRMSERRRDTGAKIRLVIARHVAISLNIPSGDHFCSMLLEGAQELFDSFRFYHQVAQIWFLVHYNKQ